MNLIPINKLIFGIDCFVSFIGEERKTPSDSNSPSSSSLSTLSDSVNSKEDIEISPKSKGSTNLLVISVVPGSQSLLNTDEKSEKGKTVPWNHTHFFLLCKTQQSDFRQSDFSSGIASRGAVFLRFHSWVGDTTSDQNFKNLEC